MTFPASLPAGHRAFLTGALDVLAADARLVGVAAAGSFATDTLDEYSDLDLVIAVEPAHAAAVAGERRSIAASLGPLLAAFTGEHVGEPRLLICLYGPPLLHVDLKFVALPDVAKRVDEVVVLSDRDGRVAATLRTDVAHYPAPDPQWIEDRFWTWVHYVAAKIARGELFEAVDGLAFLRGLALGPLAMLRAGARPCGVRRLEQAVPDVAAELRHTIAGYDARDCVRALEAAIALYRTLRPADGLVRCAAAEAAATRYLDDVARDLR